MTSTQQEGVANKLDVWLSNWDLQQYEQALRSQGINKPTDFKYIKTKKNFEQLIDKLSDNMSFMDTLKLQDAWSSIVPNPQKTEPKIYFLGDKEKEIMNKLYERFDDLSEDVNVVQKAFNDFNQSVVQCKQQINDNTEKMLNAVNNKKEQLLQKIDTIDAENKKKFNEILNKLQKMNGVCTNSKVDYTKIVTKTDIAPKQRLEKLKSLLIMNIDNKNDDEKQFENNYDHYRFIGSQCKYPGKTVSTFNEQSFNNALDSCISVTCNNVTSSWKIKQYYNEFKDNNDQDIKTAPFIFDVYEPDYFAISNNGKSAKGKYGCSYSIVSTKTSYNTGIHRWKIKFGQKVHAHSNPGVITNVTGLSQIGRGYGSHGSKLCGHVYMWHDYDKALQGYQNGIKVIESMKGLTNIQPNEIITVI
eukprot:502689_1